MKSWVRGRASAVHPTPRGRDPPHPSTFLLSAVTVHVMPKTKLEAGGYK